jgi:hypothetical protein
MKAIAGDGNPIEVLLVEDSPGDVRLTREAFSDASTSIHLNVVSDGVEAMTFLRHEGAYVHSPRPELIFSISYNGRSGNLPVGDRISWPCR